MHTQVDPFLIDRAVGYFSLGAKSDRSIKEAEPSTMVFAFASELVLKGLGAKEQSHNLSELFANLPAERQAWLTERYQELDGDDLSEDLATCADVFYNIRYWHEKGGGAFPARLSMKLARFLTAAGVAATSERPNRQFVIQEKTFGRSMPD